MSIRGRPKAEIPFSAENRNRKYIVSGPTRLSTEAS